MEIERGLSRAAADFFRRAAGLSPVVVVLGARQVGKTTLVRSAPWLGDRPYLTLDDFDLRAQATEDPESVVARAPEMILDEVQRARELLLAVKRSVDEDRTPGRFVLTGSANLLMMEAVSETLAGRAIYLTLWPFARRERLGLGRTGLWSELLATSFGEWPELLAGEARAEEWRQAARLGGLPVPALHLATDPDRDVWFGGYVQTYLERDLRTLRAVESLPDFRRLMRAAALRIGTLLNQTELGRDVGMAQAQVHRFLNLMETSYQLVRLPPFSVNRTRRLIKSPKLYWSDTALAMHLAGESEPRGAHFENLILSELLAWRDSDARGASLLYWRTATGLEVDFVVETARRVLPIEVKCTARPTKKDAHALEQFLADYPDLAPAGLLLHTGNEIYPLAKNILAAPWWKVC